MAMYTIGNGMVAIDLQDFDIKNNTKINAKCSLKLIWLLVAESLTT